ncbi:MAG: hypothetical protein RL026_899 [Pseudomonadota bacterium]
MHDTALDSGAKFFAQYSPPCAAGEVVRVVDIGSQDVNGSLREVCPPQYDYLGLDYAAGKGVDRVMTDPCQIPLPTGSADLVVSSSCFEHAELFWVLYLEALRILKPHGLLYLNAPSAGGVHRYPLDCWRFYPDSGLALSRWAHHSGLQEVALLESFIDSNGMWGDFVGIYLRDARFAAHYPQRVHALKPGVTNIRCIEQGDEVVWPAGYVVRPPPVLSLRQRALRRLRGLLSAP